MDGPKEEIMKKVNDCKRVFHMDRCLEIKHLPRDVTKSEIQEMLSDLPVSLVRLSEPTLKSRLAIAELSDPKVLEEWDKSREFVLRGQVVSVTPSENKLWLCVAKLPPHFSQKQFTTLVQHCGDMQCCFLMISEKTGESKGYGFVNYSTLEVSLKAKHILDGKPVGGNAILCDWLEPGYITYKSLHSKCLYVHDLPENFRNMGQFRQIFSKIVNPLFCQVALKNGCPQDWGLVEYSNHEEAEDTQTILNGYKLCGHNIKISYYIPGVSAINIFQNFLRKPDVKGKKLAGLLPDPPTSVVIMQNLKSLFNKNPKFAQSLQRIMADAVLSKDLPCDSNKKVSTLSVSPELCMSPLVSSPPPNVNSVYWLPLPPPPPPPRPPQSPTTHQFFNPPLPSQPNKVLLPTPPSPPRCLSLSPPTSEGSLSQPAKENNPPDRVDWSSGLLPTYPSLPHQPIAQAPLYSSPPPCTPAEPQQNLLTLFLNSPQLSQPVSMFYPNLMQNPPWVSVSSFSLITTCSLHTNSIPVPMEHKTFVQDRHPNIFPQWAPQFLPHFPCPQPMFSPFGSQECMNQPLPAMHQKPNEPRNQMMTPVGQKRRTLPEPEPSPEGNYIGQHSQGLGGHYAESYFKRYKRN